jgi:uncharacterized membrane protein HdeD (DUF308 family)
MNGNPVLARDLWWVGVIQGVAALLFGIAALFWPGLTLVTLVYLFSAYVFVWAIFEIVHSLMSMRESGTWWLSLLFGLFGLGVGVYLIRHPHVAFATFILLIGFTLIMRGLIDIIGAFLVNNMATFRVLSIIVGAIAVLAGIIVLKQPVSGGVAFVWVLGLYSLIYGPICLALAFDLKRLGEAEVR